MSAPQIPNLNTLRRGGGQGRGRVRGGPSITGHNRGLSQNAKDEIVQKTDDDAALSRMSAVEVGYLDDPFARYFAAGYAQRRFPIINRGTYVRTTAIDILVDSFLGSDHSTRKQIISLGAGTDTRFFRLARKRPSTSLLYHELDFPQNTKKKIRAMKETPELLSKLMSIDSEDVSISVDGATLYSPSLNIHPVDLRSLHPSSTLTLRGIDTSLPTLLISECCLIYLDPTSADAVLQYFTTIFPQTTPLGLIVYEPINPFDPFGMTMEVNLAARGIVLQTLHKYSSLPLQRQRLKDRGFGSGQQASDIDFLWEKWVIKSEKGRVSELEMLDEIEEWQMLARHYCVAWGWRDERNAFQGWNDLQGQGE
ncbi:MAG: carboxy methyl transferase for protein phosphatase 2A [Cirrosporium novae-zelandiae]|nr:MAG: carboxy methyl transferase for protein phosphatase 2A [Cirrosporium novae-zelandiae]